MLRAALACVLVTALAWAAGFELAAGREADGDLLTAFLEFEERTPAAEGAARALHRALHPLLLAVLAGAAAGVALLRRDRVAAVAAGATFSTAVALSQLLQALLSRGRSHDVLYMEEVPWPSGHAAAVVAAAAAAVLAAPLHRRRLAGAVAGAVAFADCVSILVIHHHFPSDVLGGAALAGACGFAAAAWARASRVQTAPGREGDR